MWEQLLDHLQVDEIGVYDLLFHVCVLLIALLVALPVAWDREKATRAMGLRTFPLVAVASAAFVMITREVIGDGAEANARVLQGLMTGIGFLGGGAILKGEDRVRGTATAAAIWGTAAIGAAVAHGRIEIALVLSGVSFALLRFLQPVKRQIDREADSEWEDTEGGEDRPRRAVKRARSSDD